MMATPAKHTCRICLQSYLSKRGLRTHMGRKHNIASESQIMTYYCHICDVIVNGESRVRHERFHDDERSQEVPEEKAPSVNSGNSGSDGEYGFHGDMDVDEAREIRFRTMNRQSEVEQAVVASMTFGPGEDEQAIKARTNAAFGDIAVKHNLSHRLGNDILHFLKDPKYDPSYLPKDMRTVFSRVDKRATATGNTFEAGVHARYSRITVDPIQGCDDGGRFDNIMFIHYSMEDAIRTLVQGTPDSERFLVQGEVLINGETGEREYEELHTGKAWERHETHIHQVFPDAVLGGVLLYADETTTNTIRGKTFYPIICALGTNFND